MTAPAKKAAPRKSAAPAKKAVAPRKAAAAPKLPEFKTPEEATEFFKGEISKIGTGLMKAATKNGMCDTYDREVAALNKTLAVALPERKKTYVVQVYVDIEVPNGTHVAQRYGAKIISAADARTMRADLIAKGIKVSEGHLTSETYVSEIMSVSGEVV